MTKLKLKWNSMDTTLSYKPLSIPRKPFSYHRSEINSKNIFDDDENIDIKRSIIIPLGYKH